MHKTLVELVMTLMFFKLAILVIYIDNFTQNSKQSILEILFQFLRNLLARCYSKQILLLNQCHSTNIQNEFSIFNFLYCKLLYICIYVGYALKSQLQEVGNSEEQMPCCARRQERPRLACGFCCLARGADGLALGAARVGLLILWKNMF